MNLGKTFQNPYVIGGGLLIGVVVLLSSGGAKASGGDSASSGAYLSFLAQQNASGMAYASDMAGVSANLAGKRIDASTTEHLRIIDAISNMFNVNAQQDVQNHAINAQVTTTRLQSDNAYRIEQAQQSTRLQTSYVEADTARYGLDVSKAIADLQMRGQMQIAQTQASAQETVAKTNVVGGLLNTALGGVLKFITPAKT